MIRIINEADDVVVYEADEVMNLANDIMTLYTAEHERHRKVVGNIFNQNRADLDRLTQLLESESALYEQNLNKIKQQETEQLTDIYDITIS